MKESKFFESIQSQVGKEIVSNVSDVIVRVLKLAGAKTVQKNILNSSSERFSEWILSNFGKVDLYLANRQVSVDQLHVELKFSDSIQSRIFSSKTKVLQEIQSGKMDSVVSYTALEILDSCTDSSGDEIPVDEDLIIVGTAGSGKTTTFKNIAVQKARGRFVRGHKKIPFLIQLRNLSSDETIYQNMTGIAKSCFSWDPEIFMDSLLKSGLCLILLDGFDEVKKERRIELMREIRGLRLLSRDESERNVICLSGRPSMLDTEFDGFSKFEVLPFDLRSKKDFIFKWFGSKKISSAKKLEKHLEIKETLIKSSKMA